MNHTAELEKALTDLRHITGISMEIHAETEEEVTKALEQLKLLSSAYKEKYNKIHFLQSLMTDSIPTYNVYDRAARLHIAPEEPRILYLLETSHSLDEDISEILKNLFPSQSGAFRIPLTEASCAILCPVRSLADSSQETVHLTARMIVDTVNAEALARVRVSYSKTLHNLLDLSTAFRETSLALKVGKLFYSEQTVFPYNRLGIGRLIYRLPTSLCENFLHEIFERRFHRHWMKKPLQPLISFYRIT